MTLENKDVSDLRRASAESRNLLLQAVAWVSKHPVEGVHPTTATKVVIAIMDGRAALEVASVYAGRPATFRSEVRDLLEQVSTVRATVVPVGIVQQSGTVAVVSGALGGTVMGSLAPGEG